VCDRLAPFTVDDALAGHSELDDVPADARVNDPRRGDHALIGPHRATS
jgi:hypothetical protein